MHGNEFCVFADKASSALATPSLPARTTLPQDRPVQRPGLPVAATAATRRRLPQRPPPPRRLRQHRLLSLHRPGRPMPEDQQVNLMLYTQYYYYYTYYIPQRLKYITPVNIHTMYYYHYYTYSLF